MYWNALYLLSYIFVSFEKLTGLKKNHDTNVHKYTPFF